MSHYNFAEIEPKWQKYWDDHKIYKVNDDISHEDFAKPKYFILDMFPYPSGAGLHIGHPEGYTATDIVSRYKRMKGFNVLHPIGFDAFGLPTERYSMTTGIHPEKATEVNIANFTRQLKMLGFDYDWDRVVNTTNPGYYKWTQSMFLLIYNSWYDKNQQKARPIEELEIPSHLTDEVEIEKYKDDHRLAYIAMVPVNWCEALGTVLANEEVDEWKEKGYSVERKPMRQWMLRITEYADRLLKDLDLVDWPASTMEMQKHWIGKSEGAEVIFSVENSDAKIKVFTTRPDTLFGATYIVLAPEHNLVKEICSPEQKETIEKYITEASFKSDLERGELNKEKTGVHTGAYAINPANSARIPILIADYVLAGYGTGAIMAVPGHDQRDWEFAKSMGLKIVQVVRPSDNQEWDFDASAFTEYGIATNSETCDFSIDGLPTAEAKKKVIAWLEEHNLGQGKIQFRLRDWLFSRQRYWGEPIPIMFYEDGSKRALNEDELPLVLPPVQDFLPAGTGESPLAKVESWVDFIDPLSGKKAKFETNTMPQWAGSCWYYLRFTDTKNDQEFADPDKEAYWMDESGVDLYVGGAEHAVLHLLYARFWHKVLYDYEMVSTLEPFKKLFHQGLILGEDGRKMSKSLGNVVNPDLIVSQYGADSLRIFEMFLGPLEASKPWQTTGIEGVNRFLNRVWRMIVDENGNLSANIQDIAANKDQEYILHSTIKKIGEDIENLSFNTSISAMMIFVNEMYKYQEKPKSVVEKFILLLAPFAPHICEELWQILGHDTSIVKASFPDYDLAKTVKQEVEMVIQVSSKIRSRITVALNASQADVEELAKADENVMKHLEGKEIKKVVHVPNKILNFIVA